MTIPVTGYDVVIVGAGLAGLSAALTVAEFGLNPIVFEKADKPGGATAYSYGGFNAADSGRQIPLGIEDSPEKHFRQALKRSGDKGREPLLKTLCYEAYGTQQWLETIGVQFEDRIYRAPGSHFPRTHKPVQQSGAAYIEALLRALEPFEVPIVTEAEVKTLIRARAADREGYEGPVTGVRGVCRGQAFTCHARCGVVLASGSFIRNPSMMALYAPGLAHVAPWFDVGAEGIMHQAATDIGAGLVGMSYFEIGCTSSTFGIPNDPSRFILVNRLGERFVREDLQKTEILQAVLRQPDSEAWMIAHGQDHRDPLAQPALEQLLMRALDRFNESVMLERPDPFGRDPRLLRVIEKPFSVSKLTPKLLTSYGGIEIDETARVLDRYGQPIEGLTAAGDVTGGIHGEHALYGDLLASAAVFGRIAARTLVWSGRKRPIGRRRMSR